MQGGKYRVAVTSPDLAGRLAISARARLAEKLNQLLDEMQLSQKQAASILGIPQPRISAIRNNKLAGISLERLMQALRVLGQDVEIRVSPSSGRRDA